MPPLIFSPQSTPLQNSERETEHLRSHWRWARANPQRESARKQPPCDLRLAFHVSLGTFRDVHIATLRGPQKTNTFSILWRQSVLECKPWRSRFPGADIPDPFVMGSAFLTANPPTAAPASAARRAASDQLAGSTDRGRGWHLPPSA